MSKTPQPNALDAFLAAPVPQHKSKMAGKWGHAVTKHSAFYGDFNTAEEAAEDAGHPLCFVGQYRAPHIHMLDADHVLDHIACQDDFCGDYAEGITETKAQMQELDDAMHAVLFHWLDKHDLWPQFCIVENAIRISELGTGGQAEVEGEK